MHAPVINIRPGVTSLHITRSKIQAPTGNVVDDNFCSIYSSTIPTTMHISMNLFNTSVMMPGITTRDMGRFNNLLRGRLVL